jgi:hypothetical protein
MNNNKRREERMLRILEWFNEIVDGEKILKHGDHYKMSKPSIFVYKGIRNPLNDDWKREEFEKRNKDRIFDFEKTKYYIPI